MVKRALNALAGREMVGGHPQDHDLSALAKLIPGQPVKVRIDDVS